MTDLHYRAPDSEALRERAADNLRSARNELTIRVNGIISWLLGVEWVAMIVTALIMSPRTWSGAHSRVHPHLWAAILAGPAFIIPAILFARYYPLREMAPHALAVAQILVSILLIGITGGRIETHFHVFGSLAILAFYRDWRVLVTASALTALDHVVRGVAWPQSVYGVMVVSPWRWVEHAFWVAFEDFFLILGSTRSIHEMRTVAMREAQLSWGAFYDVLTGLGNRRLLQQRFNSGQIAGPNSRRAILFLDLDRFKHANDTLGHTIGDKLLKLVADRLSQTLTGNQLVARIGGDEFVILTDLADSAEASDLAKRLLTALSQPFNVEGHQLLLSASVGISLAPEHGSALSELQERADRAMYTAKARGRNECVIFSSEVAAREKVLQQIGRDLSQALQRGEMSVHYQPLMGRGEIIGFEALVRWNHPVHGSVPPSEFIPLAEKSGLIVGLGEWVLRKACLKCVEWNKGRNKKLGIAVNVSAVQFDDAGFTDRVRTVLEECDFAPSLLTLELTEGVLLRNVERARSNLTGLRMQGVRVALDDFGTGYSSLSYLATLPADIIKLDRSFLSREIANGPAVVQSIIEMAHRIGLRVVAEGVETRDQNDRLLALNCDELQGFYFSKPLTPDAVEAFLDRQPGQNSIGQLLATPEMAH